MTEDIRNWYCTSLESFRTVVQSSSSDRTYEVRRDDSSHKYIDETTYEWSCTCPSYEHQCGPYREKRHCKHIEKVKDSDAYCGWQGDEPEYGEHARAHCPECGRRAKVEEL